MCCRLESRAAGTDKSPLRQLAETTKPLQIGLATSFTNEARVAPESVGKSESQLFPALRMANSTRATDNAATIGGGTAKPFYLFTARGPPFMGAKLLIINRKPGSRAPFKVNRSVNITEIIHI